MRFNLNRIKAERIARGVTQLEMAEKLGISDSAYNKIENGNRKIDVDMFTEIVNVLGIKDEGVLIFFN